MTLVRKIDDAWQAVTGVVNLEKQGETYTLDMAKVEALVNQGQWDDDDLSPYGLKVAAPFVAPEGKQAVGSVRYVEADGVVSEEYDVEDIPPPPPPPTPEEKLASAGLTQDEFDALVAAAIARQQG